MAAPSVVSLFTGAGGLDLGLERAGFEIQLCVENDSRCRETLKRNRPGWRLSDPGDIFRLDSTALRAQAKVGRRRPALVAAGPPCQPFSKAGNWVSGGPAGLRDPRARTFTAMLDVVEDLLPEVVLIENVEGLTYREGHSGWHLLRRGFARINRTHDTNYLPALLRLNAMWYGVPQSRERIFVIAHRRGRALPRPIPTHWPKDGIGQNGAQPYRTAWDAIGDLDAPNPGADLDPRGKWSKLLPSIPEGSNYLWHTERGGGKPLFGWRRRYWSFLLKLSKDRPSWTIAAHPGPATGPFHWKSRLLSIRELCRIQTFPDDYEIVGSRGEAVSQIGNAVPPAMGELLGLAIRKHLLREKVTLSPLSLIPPCRGRPPRPASPGDVAGKFLTLEGRHKDHPGVGLGPRALILAASKGLGGRHV